MSTWEYGINAGASWADVARQYFSSRGAFGHDRVPYPNAQAPERWLRMWQPGTKGPEALPPEQIVLFAQAHLAFIASLGIIQLPQTEALLTYQPSPSGPNTLTLYFSVDHIEGARLYEVRNYDYTKYVAAMQAMLRARLEYCAYVRATNQPVFLSELSMHQYILDAQGKVTLIDIEPMMRSTADQVWVTEQTQLIDQCQSFGVITGEQAATMRQSL